MTGSPQKEDPNIINLEREKSPKTIPVTYLNWAVYTRNPRVLGQVRLCQIYDWT